MSDFLATMAEGSAARSAQAQSRHSEAQLLNIADTATRPPPLKLHRRFSVIAEIKANSPAEGALADSTMDRAERARDYRDGGASAISVLTEPARFGGELNHLAEVAATLGVDGVPAMRKDFLVDTYQVVEARVAGAGGVLLIVAMLDDARLAAMLARAAELGLFVLIECFDRDDLARAMRALESQQITAHLESGQIILGVNTRDLRTLQVDTERLSTLSHQLPEGIVTVAESGLKQPNDAARAVELGYRAALIGTALMRADDPAELLRAFLKAGRSA